MAPAADEQKVSLDARGVLIMVVAIGGIVGLWVNGEWRRPRPAGFPGCARYRTSEGARILFLLTSWKRMQGRPLAAADSHLRQMRGGVLGQTESIPE
ncbi:hypothetical protein HPB50_005736 [Hyalomma asiaticum]|uniref:Uncharacterized protein n=1 Tax=Hyalomma asiaticum TaxID=266040 RepID=A0ACB7SQL5_HYAAI|nr:hypothetical protein HPB50_005736 [Hyalomma asiaticum]